MASPDGRPVSFHDIDIPWHTHADDLDRIEAESAAHMRPGEIYVKNQGSDRYKVDEYAPRRSVSPPKPRKGRNRG